MQHPKNIQFTQLIKAGGRLREFNFRRSQGPEGPLITVDVADSNGERHYISFQMEDDQWILKTKYMADWIEEAITRIRLALGTEG